jgi:hypothetical protein
MRPFGLKSRCMFSPGGKSTGKHQMEHMTADGGCPPEAPARASLPDLERDFGLVLDPDLEPDADRALARAIRRLIAVTRASSETFPNLG